MISGLDAKGSTFPLCAKTLAILYMGRVLQLNLKVIVGRLHAL